MSVQEQQQELQGDACAAGCCDEAQQAGSKAYWIGIGALVAVIAIGSLIGAVVG